MTTLNYTVNFRRTVLASFIGLTLSHSCFALEALSDAKLSETTGEGIALLPKNAYMVFSAVGENQTQDKIIGNRTLDTGYIHYVPLGPLSSLIQDTNKDGRVNENDHSVGKADLYLYGLALSKNADNDANSRLDSGMTIGIADAAIGSWGTTENPWILTVKTDTNVPNFGTGAAASTGPVTSLNFEAPLYEDIYKFTNNVLTVNALSNDMDGADAYNLKLGLWADAFVRDQSKIDGDINQFNLGENFSSTATGRANRIRLQGIFNGFGLNGSKVQVFQTLAGATNSGGMSAFYNNTLGISGVIRLNSGDGSKLLGVTATQWKVPTNLNNHILRLSTQECGVGSMSAVVGCTSASTAQEILNTPALNGGVAPIFDEVEGLFIYNLNTNLVLGSLYQPLIVGSDGKNFSLELAQIPNKTEVYQKIYIAYEGAGTAANGILTAQEKSDYKGSTCNVYSCGVSTIAGYQGSSATHSSIGIGTVYSPDGGKTLLADKTAGAIGISFGQLKDSTSSSSSLNNLGSAVIDGLLIQHMKIKTTGL